MAFHFSTDKILEALLPLVLAKPKAPQLMAGITELLARFTAPLLHPAPKSQPKGGGGFHFPPPHDKALCPCLGT